MKHFTDNIVNLPYIYDKCSVKKSIAQSVVQFYHWFDFYFPLNQNSLKDNIIQKKNDIYTKEKFYYNNHTKLS